MAALTPESSFEPTLCGRRLEPGPRASTQPALAAHAPAVSLARTSGLTARTLGSPAPR